MCYWVIISQNHFLTLRASLSQIAETPLKLFVSEVRFYSNRDHTKEIIFMKTYLASFSKRTRVFWGGLLLTTVAALLFTACGGATTTATTATPTVAPTATTAPPTATPTTAALAVVKTGTAKAKSGSETVLTNAQGLTLYYFDPDTATTSACTGGCAAAWPPLLFSGSGQPTAEGSLPGQLTVVTTANGKEVAYNGHLLYTFKSDEAAGTAEGDGLGGKWHVATPNLPAKS